MPLPIRFTVALALVVIALVVGGSLVLHLAPRIIVTERTQFTSPAQARTWLALEPRALEAPPAEPAPSVEVYLHVATLGQWRMIVDRTLARLRASGVWPAPGSRLTVVGTGPATDALLARLLPLEAEGCRALDRRHALKNFERTTLYQMTADLRRAQRNGDPLPDVLYLHSKGVTRYGGPHGANVLDWVDYMHHFLLDRHAECRHWLASGAVDTVGVSLRAKPQPHYSGNFWWARGAFLLKLPEPIGNKYLDPEMWLGRAQPRALTLWQSGGVLHHRTPYPASLYAAEASRPRVARWPGEVRVESRSEQEVEATEEEGVVGSTVEVEVE